MACHFKTFAQVEAVRGVTRVTGVEVHGIAALLNRLVGQPVQKGSRMTFTPGTGQSGEIIDVEHLPPCQELAKAKTCSTDDLACLFDCRDFITLNFLPAHLRQKLGRSEMGPQCRKNAKTSF